MSQPVSAVLEAWINHYQVFSTEAWEHATGKRNEPVTRHTAIERMNSGDCGTTAIAVSTVFNQLQHEAAGNHRYERMVCWDNFNHAYVEFNGRYYDTFDLNGKENRSEMYEHDAPNAKDEQLSVESIFKRYIYKDRIGAHLIKTFCQRWYVPVPAVVTALLDEPMARRDEYLDSWLDYVRKQLEACEAFRAEPVEEELTDEADVIEIEGPLDADPSAHLISQVANS
jgi:hypothetical protein